MKKTTQGFLAGAAGLGLLLGGSTFALWSDSAELSNQRITSGNLQVQVNEANWRDISPDRTDKGRNGHPIDLASFRIIPGDKIQAKYPIKVTLEGENMVAKLKLAQAGRGGASGDLARGLDIKYEVQDKHGKTVKTGGRDGALVTLASKDNGNPGKLPRVGADRDGRAEFTVVVTVTFKENTSERDLTRAQALLKNSELELQQVRSGADGYRGDGDRDRDRDRDGDRDRDRDRDGDRDRDRGDRGDRDGDRDRGDRDRGDRDRGDRGDRGDRDRGDRGNRG